MGHVGKQTLVFKNPPTIAFTYANVGHKESQGPLASFFDHTFSDDLLGQETWEKAESMMVKKTMDGLFKKARKTPEEVQYLFAGDLLNQLAGSSFGLRDFKIPFFGLYGACSTMGESLCLASMTIAGGFADCVIAGASSHYCAAEKQFRFPLEYGAQRSLTQQWTVTGCGFAMLTRNGQGPKITAVTPGKIVDFDIKDSFNMGAAMAPAAVDTILTHLEDTGQKPTDFDAILTGDLGQCGKDIAIELANKLGVDISPVFNDCGLLIFDNQTQDTHAGGSGCGCSASVFCGYLYKQLMEKKMKKILLVPTGALMSPITTQQGESILGVAHAVCIEMV